MTRPFRHLLTTLATSTPPPHEQVSSDFIMVLAALLCALMCFLGVLAIARCASLSNNSSHHQRPPANEGLKKKALKSLPTQPYSSEFVHAECVICLAEFADGEVLRVLPLCGHGFHVACIDTWLESSSSCPSCRHVLADRRCRKCGGVPSVTPQRVDVEAPASTSQYLP